MTEILGDQGSLLWGGHPFLAVLLSEHRGEQSGGGWVWAQPQQVALT